MKLHTMRERVNELDESTVEIIKTNTEKKD